MRILASNPDTIGDLILRQPMYRAWREAGHELMLVVRPGVTPVVPYVAPAARVLELPYEAYAPDIAQHWDRFAGLFDAARAFEPDALVVAPYRWTAFDERLAAEFPAGVRRVGMSGHLYRGDPNDGDAPGSSMRFDAVATVCEDALEIEKNAALAATVLGTTPAPGGATDPRIEPTYDDLQAAARILSDLNLAAGEYWIACVTGTAHVTLKTWHGDHWAQVLSKWAAGRGRKFLFVGLPEEEAAARAVVDAMGGGAENARVWSGDGRTFGELVGLTALSSGYVGHDTGPMHVAAALRKPVLAVFGGGTWPRFRPAVTPSVAVTVGVSCRGCQWVCSFAQSHCIKAVPVDEVSKAADDLESGRVTGREARVLAPSAELQAQMVREAAAIARDRARAAGEASRELRGTQERWQRDVADLRDQVVAQQRHAAAQEGAVELAHADLGGQLREKESMIRRQDELLREKEAALHEQHALLQRQDDALHRTSNEAARLRDHAADADRERAGLAQALAARAGELERLQADLDAKSREAAELASSVALHEGEIERLRQDLKQVEQANRATTEARKQQGYEIGRLREQVQRLDERLRAVEPYVRYRRPLRQILVDLVIGPQHYYPPPPKNLPGITGVTVTHNSERLIRETVESVLGQDHPHVQFVVVDRGSTDSTLAIVDEYKDRFEKLVVVTEAAGGFFDAVAKGYTLATYDAVGRLDPGDVYEPGALFRVAEYFRDNRRAKAVVFEETVRRDGWRLPAPPRPAPDVYQLLRAPHEPVDGVFVTTNAYQAIDGFNRERGAAAQWDLWLRLSRRYGIHRAAGHVRSVRGVGRANADAATGGNDDRSCAAHFDNARKLFLASFGWLGRARCTLIHWFNRLGDALGGARQSRLSFAAVVDGKPLPPGQSPAHVPGQPICPLNGRLPDRLLFSARDTLGGDDAVNYIYYDSAADTALVYPPLELEKLQALYESDGNRSDAIVPPDAAHASPYAGYRGPGGRLGHLLSRVRSPWWWFAKPDFGDPSVAELLESLDGHVPRRGVSVHFLNVACYDGAVLDALKAQTDWTLFGTETNPRAAVAARAKGHLVWDTSAEDAAFELPIGQTFDVIYLGRLTEHLPDPLLVVRRLRQLLTPGGRIVLDTPNLDSKLLDVFGPTWSHWQPPYHRTLLGRRGLRTLAKLAAFRVERLRTRTHPLPAVRSAQLHALGLGAVVPDTAKFPPDVASRGVLLTGWARLLWDWRGRGDYIYAVLRAE